MYYLIGNKNVLIKTFDTEAEVKAYENSNEASWGECEFDGIYYSCAEILKRDSKSIFGVDWDNLIPAEVYKSEWKKAYEKSLKVASDEMKEAEEKGQTLDQLCGLK